MSLSNRIEQAKDGTRVIGLDNAGIWKELNRAPYLFHHTLANHPLFDIPRLPTLAKGLIDRGDPTKFALRVEGDAKFKALRGKTVYPRPYAVSKRAGFGSSYRPLEELDRDYDDILSKTIGEIKDLMGRPCGTTLACRGSRYSWHLPTW